MELQAISSEQCAQLIDEALRLQDREPEKALEAALQAEQLALALEDDGSQARALYVQGSCRLRFHDLAEADSLFAAARDLVSESDRPELLMAIAYAVGEMYRLAGRTREAERSDYALRQMAAADGGQLWRARALHSSGMTQTALGNPERGLQLLTEALAQLRGLEQPELEGRILQAQGIVYQRMGLLEKALDVLCRAEYVLRECEEGYGMGATLFSAGNVLRDLGQRSLALQYYRRAVPIFRRIGSVHGTAGALHSLGNLLYLEADYDQALAVLDECIAHCRKHNDVQVLVGALRVKGEIYLLRNEFDRSLEQLRECEALCADISDAKTIADAKLLRARYHFTCSDSATAQRNFEDIIGFFDRQQNHLNRILLLEMQSDYLAKQQQWQECLRIKEEALALARQGAYHDMRARMLAKLHGYYKTMGDEAKATTVLEEAFSEQKAIARNERQSLIERSLQTTGAATIADDATLGGDASFSAEDRLRRALQHHCPDLTPTEERVCLMLYFSMQSKEIAATLHISWLTVDWHRRCIRRKLALPRGTSIQAELQQLLDRDTSRSA